MEEEKLFTIKMDFVFSGEVKVLAKSRTEARNVVFESFGLCNATPHASSVQVQDWSIPQIPDKTINEIIEP